MDSIQAKPGLGHRFKPHATRACVMGSLLSVVEFHRVLSITNFKVQERTVVPICSLKFPAAISTYLDNNMRISRFSEIFAGVLPKGNNFLLFGVLNVNFGR